jgi:Xaa-Pro aminopeptidase
MSFENKPSRPKEPSDALVRFMMQAWAGRPSDLPGPIEMAAAHAARRLALSKQFPHECLIVPTGHEQLRANDTYFRFRPGSDFMYLTGCTEPDAVLVLAPIAGGHEAHLFVEPNPGRASETFFTDRKKGELWVGPRLGVEQSRSHYAVDAAHPLGELEAFLANYPQQRRVRGISHLIDAKRASGDGDTALATAIAEQRLLKDMSELAALRAVIASTHRGFEDVIASLKTPGTERHAEGLFNLRARVEGNDVGYGTIAASGANACILHWTRNDGRLKNGELLLLDAGVEGTTLYTADITRTVPISGRFSAEQRIVYDLVWKAQQAALAAVRPGADFMEPNRRAQRVLAEGLYQLGILRVPPDEACRDDLQKRWSLHNVSHMLGLDVHDCAKARQEVYKYGPLQAGMVLTVEPGLYFQLDDLTVPPAFRGIGVRIEDDIVVTPNGFENLSSAMPSEASAVEAWVASVWAGGTTLR